jgi:hypothetical protein
MCRSFWNHILWGNMWFLVTTKSERSFKEVSFVVVFGGNEVWLRASPLLGRHYTTWVRGPALFAFVTFCNGVLCFMPCLAWTMISPPTYALHVADRACITISPHPGFFFGWDGISQTFCPSWPWTMILPISTSQEAKITGVSHHT